MSLIRIGPFSVVHFSLLKEKLEENKIDFFVVEDPTLLDSYREQLKTHEKGRHPAHPTYSGIAPEYIFVDIKKENILIIKKELDKLGVSLVETAQPESIEEYQCKHCDYYSEKPGYCPKHDIPLITRSEWLQKKRELSFTGRIISVLLILLLLGFLIFTILSK